MYPRRLGAWRQRLRASGRSTRSARRYEGNTKREGRACRVRWGDGRRRGADSTSAALPPFRSRRIMGGPCRASSPALVLPLWRSPPRCRGGSALRGLSARAAVPAAPHFRRVPRPLQGSFCPPGRLPAESTAPVRIVPPRHPVPRPRGTKARAPCVHSPQARPYPFDRPGRVRGGSKPLRSCAE